MTTPQQQAYRNRIETIAEALYTESQHSCSMNPEENPDWGDLNEPTKDVWRDRVRQMEAELGEATAKVKRAAASRSAERQALEDQEGARELSEALYSMGRAVRFEEVNPFKETVAEEAGRIINGQRREDYGPMRPSFEMIAGLWSQYLGTEVTPLDVANLMILLKLSRTRGKFHRDSYVDVAGYALCAERITEEGSE